MSTVLPEHALYCFDVMAASLEGTRAPTPAFAGDEEFPLFVTWNVEHRGEMRLRGCIGNFEASPLGKGLHDYALISAFNDTRFEPVQLKELPRLECGVSLLTDFELCRSLYDWDLGTHGVYVQLSSSSSAPFYPSTATPSTSRESYRSLSSLPPFVAPGGTKGRPLSATFLPDVPPEQGWSREATLDHAILKAGFRGAVDDAVRARCRVVRYQSRKVLVSYRDWVTSRGR